MDGSASSLNIPDNVTLKFGGGGDLAITHDGNNSIIAENGVGDLYLQSNNASIYLRDTNSGRVMLAAKGGSGEKVELYYGGSKKFETTSDGVQVTGDILAYTASGQYFQLDKSDNSLKLSDNVKLKIGTGSDLQLYHDGSNSTIYNNAGNLTFQTNPSGSDMIFRAYNVGSTGTAQYFRLDGGTGETIFSKSLRFLDDIKLPLEIIISIVLIMIQVDMLIIKT